MNTLLVLIDFFGHPAINKDPVTDTIRYSALQNIISSRSIQKDKLHIFANKMDPRNIRLLEIKDIAKGKGYNFVVDFNYDKGEVKGVDYVENIFEMKRNTKYWQIIIGGTNLSGCVFKNKSIGAYYWNKVGYKTKIYLPLCCEYEQYGVNDFQRNMNGFAQLYVDMKAADCLGKIDIIKNRDELELPRIQKVV